MGKVSERTWFILILSFFYFIQGLPYGLQMYYIPIVLRKSNITLAKISFMRLTTVPWMLKFLWGPVFDYYKRPINVWILTCLIGSLVMFFFLSISSPSAVAILCICLVMLNFFSSVMDIAVDSLAIQNLDPKDLGLGNIGQAVGYKIGMLFSGGLLLYLYNALSWESIFRLLCILYVAIITIFWYKYLWKRSHVQKVQSAQSNKAREISFTDIIWKLVSVVYCKQNMTLVAFLLIYKIGEQGYLSMVPLYLTDSNLSMTVVTKITGFNSILSSIIGSTLSGLIISKLRWKPLITLQSTLIIRCIVLFANVLMILNLSTLDSTAFILLQWLTSAISGMITTSTFTIMMVTSQLLDKSMQASFYTFLATMEVLGKMFMTSLCGAIVQLTGYEKFFIVCSIVNMLPLLLVYMLQENYLSRLHLSNTKMN